MKPWVKYSFYILLFLLITFSGGYISKAMEDSDQYFLLMNVVWIVLYGMMGLVLGLEHLLRQYKKKGIWKINMTKIILMGVPSLYISLSPFIYYNHFVDAFLPSLLIPIRVMLWSDFDYLNIFQFLLGYIVVTSFYKCDSASGD